MLVSFCLFTQVSLREVIKSWGFLRHRDFLGIHIQLLVVSHILIFANQIDIKWFFKMAYFSVTNHVEHLNVFWLYVVIFSSVFLFSIGLLEEEAYSRGPQTF